MQILGTYVVVAPAYASEVCPIALRGVLTSVTNIAFVTGQLIANGVIAGTSKLDSHWYVSLITYKDAFKRIFIRNFVFRKKTELYGTRTRALARDLSHFTD